MKFSEYLKALNKDNKLEDFASRCNTTPGQLKQIAYGSRRAGESLAINIERESSQLFTCEELRPDVDWAYLRSTEAKTK